MKSFNSIFTVFITCSSILGQRTDLWNDLNNTSNKLNINSYIKFSKKGILLSSSNTKLFNLKDNDSIQIVKNNESVKISFKEEKDVKIKTFDSKFDLKFEGERKPFEFYKEIHNDNKDNNLNKSNISISTPYYNAFQIYTFLKEGDNCAVNLILDVLEVKENTDNKYLIGTRKICNKADKSNSDESKVKTNILSSIGGLDVTKYADGLAKFLVKRLKEELTVSFFEKFKEELNKLEILREIFPNTQKSLQRIDEIYDYSRYLNLLQESYQKDFNNLPESVDKFISGKSNIDPQYKLGVHISSKIIQGLRDKSHPGKVLASMDATYFDSLHEDIKNSFIISQTLSEALRDTVSEANTPYWIDGSKILELSQNNELLKIFIGLTLEKLRAKNPDLFAKLNDVSKVDSYTPIISEISQLTQGISSLIKANQREGNINHEDISKYIDYSLKLFKVSKKIHDTLYSTTQAKFNDFAKFLPVLEISNSLYANIATKKYSSALFNLMELIDTIPNIKNEKLISWLMKYGSFMAESIAAENSDEVANIIETYAMPSGSSRVKRNSNFNISLNSYVGIYGGEENGNGVFGISAPIGVAFSKGWGKCGSLSFFLTAIDIGAISSFRFNNEDDDVAKIYLREIISPGAFISYGFGGYPFSVNLGWQRAPLLKRVGPGTNEVDLKHNSRISVSLLVDIPLLNLYNKNNK